MWEQGRITAFGILTMGVDSNKRGNILSSTRREKSTVMVAGISSTAATTENRRLKTFSEQNKQFDPGGRREKAPPWNAAVTLPSFSGERLGGFSLFSVCASFCCCPVTPTRIGLSLSSIARPYSTPSAVPFRIAPPAVRSLWGVARCT